MNKNALTTLMIAYETNAMKIITITRGFITPLIWIHYRFHNSNHLLVLYLQNHLRLLYMNYEKIFHDEFLLGDPARYFYNICNNTSDPDYSG